jgi:hypothetical protein
MWLVLLERCWTSDRLWRHNLRSCNLCALCAQDTETSMHLLIGCVYCQEVWFKLLHPMNLHHLAPVQDPPLPD